MEKEKFQTKSTEVSKQQETKKKKYADYTAEELEAMTPSEAADLHAQHICDALNDPENHDKSN